MDVALRRMTPDEFAAHAVGLPWIRWRSDWSAADCFGLVVLYFREVMGIDLGDVPQTDVATGFVERAEHWQDCDPVPGATCWMAWRNGAPTHVGILIAPGMVLHAEGSHERGGNVRVTRLEALKRVYGDARFVRYAKC